RGFLSDMDRRPQSSLTRLLAAAAFWTPWSLAVVCPAATAAAAPSQQAAPAPEQGAAPAPGPGAPPPQGGQAPARRPAAPAPGGQPPQAGPSAGEAEPGELPFERFLPNFDVIFPEGAIDLKISRLVSKVLFEGQVRYAFVSGDITAFLRYRYYGY